MALKLPQRDKVLMLASGFSGEQIHDYPYKENGWAIVAINHGWMHYEDYDLWIYSTDYHSQSGKFPEGYTSKPHTTDYGVTCENHFGGAQACGYSITLQATYNALWYFKPKVLGFLGCDMNYTPKEDGATCVYGVGLDIKTRGISDPDRMADLHKGNHPTYLNDVYMRVVEWAAKQDCQVYNFSNDPDTRLPYTKSNPALH